jgi:integrase
MLTDNPIDRINQNGIYPDGTRPRGLYLQVTNSGAAKSWIWRFKHSGKEFHMGLGSYHDRSLEEARTERDRLRKILKLERLNPLQLRRDAEAARRAASANKMTYRACTEAYISEAQQGWRAARQAEDFVSGMVRYVYPYIGDKDVAAITKSDIVNVLQQPVSGDARYPAGKLWTARASSARRLRAQIQAVLGHAIKLDLLSTNVARLESLPLGRVVQTEQHFAALPYAEVGTFMAALREQHSVAARCLEFTILTAVRSGEALRAQWSEFDLTSKVWTIKGDRMKAGAEHRVPLTDQALAILRELPHEATYVFIGTQPDSPLPDKALRGVLKAMKRPDITPHGFRSCFMDWAHETTAFPKAVIDLALAHKIGDKVEAAYRRGDLFDKRRALMAAWAAFCSRSAVESDAQVLPLRR